jgi:hypothetical protein
VSKDFTNGTAKNWAVLAREVGATRQSIANWRKLDGAPEDPHVEQWRAFMEENNLGRSTSATLTGLRADVEREKLRKLRRENEVAEGSVVPVDAVLTINRELSARLGLLLKVKLMTELPSLCVGQPIAEIRAVAQQKIDEICDVTTEGLLNWKPPTK